MNSMNPRKKHSGDCEKKKALPEKHTEVMHGTILLLLLSHKTSPKYSTGFQTTAKSIHTVHTWRGNCVGLETNRFAERVKRHRKCEMSRPSELQVASDYLEKKETDWMKDSERAKRSLKIRRAPEQWRHQRQTSTRPVERYQTAQPSKYSQKQPEMSLKP